MPASDRPQTYALDRAATGIGLFNPTFPDFPIALLEGSQVSRDFLSDKSNIVNKNQDGALVECH
jgi:hypothetical protein